MIWKKIKKIAKVLLVLFIVSTIIFAYLANQDMKKIYGAKTQVVDYTQFETSNEAIYIEQVNILSLNGSEFIPDQSVFIENGQIVSIDSISNTLIKATHLDGRGKYLIPGLIDSHVHLFKSPNDLLLYVANGVTEIRELIGEEDHLKWKQEIKEGRIGPDMYIASPRLGSFGLLEGWWMSWTQGFNNIRNAEEAETKVKEYAKQGYDAVKIYSYLNKEAFDAVNEIAVSEGMDVVGHIPFVLGLSDIFNSNQSDIAHLEELMNAFRREYGDIENQERADGFLSYVDKRTIEIVPNLIANDISVTTTLWLTESFLRQKFELEKVLNEVQLAYENPGISEWNKRIPGGLGWLPEVNRYKLYENISEEDRTWQKMFWTTYGQACQRILKILSERGVTILAGTDANLPPTVPGFSLHDEFIAMSNAGMTNAQILRSATTIPAQRMKSNTGQILLGQKANLVILDKNPLIDIRHTQSINSVIVNGKVLNRTLLDELLGAVKAANDSSRKEDITRYENK
jgi:hypothetical protein